VTRRAIGIVRVSKDRDGESPGEQRDRIIAACKRDGLELLRVHDELDVSGGAPLAKRPGLSEAVAAVEAAVAVIDLYVDECVDAGVGAFQMGCIRTVIRRVARGNQ
jgi:DNA invertase Pin-like site-specific DNA recombinase